MDERKRWLRNRWQRKQLRRRRQQRWLRRAAAVTKGAVVERKKAAVAEGKDVFEKNEMTEMKAVSGQ